jgi:hypothetical protein
LSRGGNCLAAPLRCLVVTLALFRCCSITTGSSRQRAADRVQGTAEHRPALEPRVRQCRGVELATSIYSRLTWRVSRGTQSDAVHINSNRSLHTAQPPIAETILPATSSEALHAQANATEFFPP